MGEVRGLEDEIETGHVLRALAIKFGVAAVSIVFKARVCLLYCVHNDTNRFTPESDLV